MKILRPFLTIVLLGAIYPLQCATFSQPFQPHIFFTLIAIIIAFVEIINMLVARLEDLGG